MDFYAVCQHSGTARNDMSTVPVAGRSQIPYSDHRRKWASIVKKLMLVLILKKMQALAVHVSTYLDSDHGNEKPEQ